MMSLRSSTMKRRVAEADIRKVETKKWLVLGIRYHRRPASSGDQRGKQLSQEGGLLKINIADWKR